MKNDTGCPENGEYLEKSLTSEINKSLYLFWALSVFYKSQVFIKELIFGNFIA